MGQKVNPIGFRLAVSKDWRSKWFATGKEFTESLHADIAIRNFLKAKLMQAALSKILRGKLKRSLILRHGCEHNLLISLKTFLRKL